MDYTKVMQMLEEASLFDLFRLHGAIRDALEDKDRIRLVKNSLRVGQTATYYDSGANRLEEVEILELKQTRCAVRQLSDDSLWNILYASINMDDVDTSINSQQKYGLKKYEISIGEMLTFLDSDNIQRYGRVKRMNQKSVTLMVDNGKWRVGYSLLAKHADIESVPINDLMIAEKNYETK